MKNKRILMILPIIVIFLVICILAFLISPIKDISLSDDIKRPIGQLLTVAPATGITYDRSNNNLCFDVNFSQKDIERLIYESIKNDMKVDGLEVNIANNNFRLYISTYLLGFIKTQYILEFKPYISDNKLVFALLNVNAGRIPVSKTYALDKMKTLNFKNMTVKDDGITIEKETVEPFMFNGVNLEINKMKVSMKYQFKLIQNLKDLLEYKIPENVKIFIEDLINNFIKNSIFGEH